MTITPPFTGFTTVYDAHDYTGNSQSFMCATALPGPFYDQVASVSIVGEYGRQTSTITLNRARTNSML